MHTLVTSNNATIGNRRDRSRSICRWSPPTDSSMSQALSSRLPLSSQRKREKGLLSDVSGWTVSFPLPLEIMRMLSTALMAGIIPWREAKVSNLI